MISMMNGVARLLEEFPEWSKVVIISQQEEPFITVRFLIYNTTLRLFIYTFL